MGLSELNIQSFRFINNFGKEYTFLNPYFVFVAEYLVIFLVCATLFFWLSPRFQNKMMVISASFAFLLAELLGKIAGKLHFNYQPFVVLPNVNQLIEKAPNNSFPSDHTILFFTFCITFSLFQKRWGYAWLILAMLVGISRIWVGVHYPLDIMVSILISMTTSLLTYMHLTKLQFITRWLNIYNVFEKRFINFLLDFKLNKKSRNDF